METLLSTKCALTARGTGADAVQYSEAFSLDLSNGVEYEVVVVTLELDEEASLRVEIEESNDRQDWASVSGSTSTISAVGATYRTVPSLASAFARFKYTLDAPIAAQDTNRAVLASRVWTADL